MPKILIVDDDEGMLGMFRTRLASAYEVIGTSDPEEALGLALEHKPEAILLDLMMPQFSGFELCQTLHSLSYTSTMPIFVISGEAGAKYKQYCESLGAKGYFQKPVDFGALKAALDAEIQAKPRERRGHVRVRMQVVLKLRGADASGATFEDTIATENVSVSGFLCQCGVRLLHGATVDVFLPGEPDRFVGTAQVVRTESHGPRWQRYGFHFEEVTSNWVLQGD